MARTFIAGELEKIIAEYTTIVNPTGYDTHKFIMKLRSLVEKIEFAELAEQGITA